MASPSLKLVALLYQPFNYMLLCDLDFYVYVRKAEQSLASLQLQLSKEGNSNGWEGYIK